MSITGHQINQQLLKTLELSICLFASQDDNTNVLIDMNSKLLSLSGPWKLKEFLLGKNTFDDGR